MMLLIRVALVALALLLALDLRWPMIDDAFITFRYVDQFLAGHGWVYTPGETVLGVSTPLWMLLLSALGLFGASIPTAALVLTLLVIVLLGWLWEQRLIQQGLPPYAAMWFTPALLLAGDFHIALSSGMETWLYTACILSGFAAFGHNRTILAGLCGGLAALTRPDGAIFLLALGLVLLMRQRRALLQMGVAALVPILPWYSYAALTYGSPLPHSIDAKRVIHAAGPLRCAEVLMQYLTLATSGFVLFLCGVALLVFSLKAQPRFWRWRNEYLAALLWLALYLGGIILSGIEPAFFWYATPILIISFFYTSFVGVSAFATEPRRNLLFVAICICLAATSSLERMRSAPSLMRQELYHLIAKDILPLVKPDDVFYLGEIGALAWHFPTHRILDSAGIVSPEVLKLRREALAQSATGDPEDPLHPWSAQVIQQHRPDWIISTRAWAQMPSLLKQDWLLERYELRATYSYGRSEQNQIVVLMRLSEGK